LSTIGSWHPAHTTTIATPISGRVVEQQTAEQYIVHVKSGPRFLFEVNYLPALAANQRNEAVAGDFLTLFSDNGLFVSP